MWHADARVRVLVKPDGAASRSAWSIPLLPSALHPDLNPIEQLFAKVKVMLRTAAARSLKSLWKVVGLCIKLVPGKECAAYLANSGYRQPCRKML
jgi:hypothetical protein